MSLDDFYLAGRTMNLRTAEELREAESSRLASIALEGRKRGHHFFCHILSWLGGHLVAWGRRLEARYGPAPSAPAAPSANHLSN